ncbi:hypothetical protein ATE48_18620 [Candidatus Viadribacter manganicus]|uniref:Uncharacterized protein n=1 Tax=Candidatus Viadribacter manganicus TaxID=1759059 RepID=A0A1B1AML1_9PROT|nr:hypothetical protein ATE48_18620 [Candidatus Viadribacter manganicus]
MFTEREIAEIEAVWPENGWPGASVSDKPFLEVDAVWLPDAISAVERLIWQNIDEPLLAPGDLIRVVRRRAAKSAAEKLSTMRAGMRSGRSLTSHQQMSGNAASPTAEGAKGVDAELGVDDDLLVSTYDRLLLDRKSKRARVCAFMRAVFANDRDWRAPVWAFNERGNLSISLIRWRDDQFYRWAMRTGRSNASEGPLFVKRADLDALMGRCVEGGDFAQMLPASISMKSDLTNRAPSDLPRLTSAQNKVVEAGKRRWPDRKFPPDMNAKSICSAIEADLGSEYPDRSVVRAAFKLDGWNWPTRPRR